MNKICVVNFIFLILEQCEKNKIESFCKECVDTFCNECFENEHKSLKKKKHEKKSLKEQVKKCPIHKEMLKNYCYQCDLNLCSACTLISHKYHKQDFFETALQEIKKHTQSKLKENGDFLIENRLENTKLLYFLKNQVNLLENELKKDEN